MKLYLVHCGFYENEISDGVYESHVNFFVAAESFEAARDAARANPAFKAKRMHVDGLQEVQAVDGYALSLKTEPALEGRSIIVSNKHRDLAPKTRTSTASPTAV